jgi:4-amino-4-deoxy-L-arabinose transferase-like glycosyltransferase
VLAKGLIGAVVPAMVMLAWGLATRRAGKVAALLLWAPGWALFSAIAAPWFIAMQQRFPDFAHYFFVVQHVQRFTGSEFNNPRPVWFYVAALVLLSLPWTGWLLLRRRDAAHPGADAAVDVRSLMRTWLAVVVVFFSLPNSKLVGYILPALAPLAYLIAESSRAVDGRWRRRCAGLAAACCVGAAVAAHYVQPKSREALALHLQAARLPAEPVIYLGDYAYDVAFYAHLDAPVQVVDRWLPDEVAKDSWRRELVDAAHFAGREAPRRLLGPDALDATLCRSTGAWIIGHWPAAAEPRWL